MLANVKNVLIGDNIMQTYKLYVWDNYSCDYTPGIAFAVAKNVTQARKLISEKFEEVYLRKMALEEIKGRPTVHPLDKPLAYEVPGGG
jgi:hypothetical protein